MNVGIDSQFEIIPDVKKWFDRRRRRLVIIGIKNDGAQPVVPSDYVRDITFCFGDRALVQYAKILQSHPPNIHPSLVIEKGCLKVEPTLLNPGNAFVIQIVVLHYGGFRPDGRISGGHLYEYDDKRPITYRTWVIVLIAAVVWSTSYFLLGSGPSKRLIAGIITTLAMMLLSLANVLRLWLLPSAAIRRWKNVGKNAEKDIDGPKQVG